MARQRLTDRSINRKPPASGQIEIWDSVVPGFGLRISYGGKRTYCVMTRINGHQVRRTVGTTVTHTLAEAREAARDILRDAAKGIDTKDRERIERREAQKGQQNTFDAIAALYMQEHASKRKSGDELQRKLDKDILPEIGHLPITDITRDGASSRHASRKPGAVFGLPPGFGEAEPLSQRPFSSRSTIVIFPCFHVFPADVIASCL